LPPPVPVAANDISIDGFVLPAVSKQGFKMTSHGGMSGGGPEVNAYAMNPARCNTTPALTHSWQHNIDLSNYQGTYDYIAMGRGEALSMKFTVGRTDTGGGISYADAAAAGANVRPAFMTISEKPCDFNVSKVLTSAGTGSACYVSGINGTTVNWANIEGPLPVSYCRLDKGRTYYLNIRFQDARPNGSPTSDACRVGEVCGGILQWF
jgi:hypothetical protein